MSTLTPIAAANSAEVVALAPADVLERHHQGVRTFWNGYAAGMLAGLKRAGDDEETVHFEPFVGVGPRRFFDLFSMRLGSGYPLKRKDDEGQIVEWKQETSRLRIQMLPCSYVELELIASSLFNKVRKAKEDAHDK